MKGSTAAPSESEIDFGVFSEKTGNRLEKIFKSSSAPRGTISSIIDISKITPPASPPSKPLDLSHPCPDLKGKGKEDDVEFDHTEKVVENVAAGAERDEVHAEGAMGEDTLEFEDAKRAFAEEREAFNADKKGLLWRVADAEEKLAKEKQYNADRQKDWENSFERSNRELKAARDKIVWLKGEKTKQSDEHEQAVFVYQKRENEYIHRLAKLEKVVAEKTTESGDAYNSGRKDGYGEGWAAAATNEKDYHFDLYKEDCIAA
ncbi:hypothetical protein Hanom_Chr10g00944331 [Helianthus anomalus]